MKLKVILQALVLLFPILILAQKTKSMEKITINNHTQKIDINNLEYWVMNDGKGATDPTQANALGAYFPKGTTKSVVYQDGVIWSGKLKLPDGSKSLRTGGGTYVGGLQAGKILTPGIVSGQNYISPVAEDPTLSKNKIYKVQKNSDLLPDSEIKNELLADYNNWPYSDGAPLLEDFNSIGDQILYFVANDVNAAKNKLLYGTDPIGLEIQTTVTGFGVATYGNSVFIKKILINKSGLDVDSMYISQWCDPDLGDAADDLVGVDTLLNFGFCYNGKTNDQIYGSTPPAIGYSFLQTPKIKTNNNSDIASYMGKRLKGFKNIGLSSFVYHIGGGPITIADPPLGSIAGSKVCYNYQRGLDYNGNPLSDNSGKTTKFLVSGDPVSGTGDIDGIKYTLGDRRFLISTGPFSMAPGDTQEVIIAMFAAQGSSNINSVTVLRNFFAGFNKDKVLDVSERISAKSFDLLHAYPNPFNPSTTIEFNLETGSTISINIFNLLGQKIKTVQDGFLNNGKHSVSWNGKDEKGRAVGSGMYFARISDSKMSLTQKLILAK